MPSNMAAVWWDILLEAVALVVGVLVGGGLQRLAYKRGGDNSGAPNLSHVNVVTIVQVAQEQSRPPRRGESAPSAQVDRNDDESIWTALVVAAIVMVGAAVSYARYRELILTVLSLLTVFGLGLTIGNIWFLARRGLVLPTAWRLLLLLSVLFVCMIPLHMYLLDHPMFPYPGRYSDVLTAFSRVGWSGAVQSHGFDIVFLLALQLIGVLVVLATSLLLAVSLLFLLAVVNVAANARGVAVWRWIQGKVEGGLLGRPVQTMFLTGCMVVLSLMLTGGVFASWQHQNSNSVPVSVRPDASSAAR